ncbi:MAG: sugar porter family MFS transporter [Muribaculaceae bacterium]|nr:sugar porter family MFS transporter [Muribaculaceae bacterium]
MKTQSNPTQTSPSTGEVCLSTMPLGWRHYRIVFTASLGQLIGTALATMVSVMIPMIQIVSHPELSSFMQGLMGAMDLIGIAAGSVVIGKLTDRYGYLLFFRLCPVMILLAAVMGLIWPTVAVTLVSLFLMGFAIGGEYSLDSDYVSELLPIKWRSTMVGVTKAASALGNILVAGACWALLLYWNAATAWPKLLWMMVLISGIMIASRIHFAGSPYWLAEHGRLKEGEAAAKYLLGDDVTLDLAQIEADEKKKAEEKSNRTGLRSFIAKNGRKIILTGVPWACEGLGVYGIGVFLPILLLALGIGHESPGASQYMHVTYSVKMTFWISCVMLPGFIIGLVLIPKMRSVKILSWGFYLSAASLVLLWLGYDLKWHAAITVVAFMLFELFLNAGPHLITYVLPPEVYPVKDRSLGSGIAACLGKVGAVLAVFFIPLMLKWGGVNLVLIVSTVTMIVGGLITTVFSSLVTKKS